MSFRGEEEGSSVNRRDDFAVFLRLFAKAYQVIDATFLDCQQGAHRRTRSLQTGRVSMVETV